MDEVAGLRKISEVRKLAFKLSNPIILCLVAGLAASMFIPFFAPIFGLLTGLWYTGVFSPLHASPALIATNRLVVTQTSY